MDIGQDQAGFIAAAFIAVVIPFIAGLAKGFRPVSMEEQAMRGSEKRYLFALWQSDSWR